MKAYTSLEQSQKLAEILPFESADYYHAPDADIVITEPYITYLGEEKCIPAYKGAVPCWSLAALLAVLPDYSLQTNADGTVFVVCKSKKPMMSDAYDDPVDACYEMIMRLHEFNLL